MFKYIDALNSLYPNKKFGITDNDYSKLIWGEDDIPKPTKLELDAEIERISILWPIYKNRINEYPPIGDQLDDLFHAGAFSEEMTLKIQMVKDKFNLENN